MKKVDLKGTDDSINRKIGEKIGLKVKIFSGFLYYKSDDLRGFWEILPNYCKNLSAIFPLFNALKGNYHITKRFVQMPDADLQIDLNDKCLARGLSELFLEAYKR